MKIDASSLTIPQVSRKPVGIVQPEILGGGPGGLPPLTRSDYELIKAATNTEFNWPPREGERYPQAASDVAMMRARQQAEGSVLKDLTNKDLLAMNRLGIIDDTFLVRAQDYLADGVRPGDVAGRTDLTRSVAQQQAEKAASARVDETGASTRVYL